MALLVVDDFITLITEKVDLTSSSLLGPDEVTINTISLGSSEYAHFGIAILGVFQDEEFVAFANPFISESPAAEVPTGADPPFPNVYPYPINSGEVYGRDHLNVNIKMVRRDTFVFDSVALNSDGTFFDLTGYTLTMTCKWNPRDASNIFQLTSPSSGISITSAVDGEFTVTISSASTSSLPNRTLYLPFDISATNGSVTKTLTRGTLTIVPDIT